MLCISLIGELALKFDSKNMATVQMWNILKKK